jgi:GABA(A) receptor-associated protein
MDFKDKVSFKERQLESDRIRTKHPLRIPVICQRIKASSKICPHIDKTKYLIPLDLTIGQFIWVIRTRLKLNQSIGLYMFINGTMPPVGNLIGHIYSTHKDEDGFLYIYYNTENTFG